MFTPVSIRSANSYQNLASETSVSQADPHQLVSLLFEGLLQSLVCAKGAILNKDIPAKGRSISKAVRILEEGLKAGLDLQHGGELALNLCSLYDFCIFAITDANLHNDIQKIDKVINLIKPVADGWSQIKNEASARSRAA